MPNFIDNDGKKERIKYVLLHQPFKDSDADYYVLDEYEKAVEWFESLSYDNNFRVSLHEVLYDLPLEAIADVVENDDEPIRKQINPDFDPPMPPLRLPGESGYPGVYCPSID